MDAPDGRCAEIRTLLPELSLGIADGKDRAVALEHLSTCAECRKELAELSMVADDLLALAPAADPPAGFDQRVLKRLGVRERRAKTRTRRRRLTYLSSAVAAAAATAAGLAIAYSGDLRLASQYRAALNDAHGQYFASAPLRTSDGREAGVAFGYQGSPSWMFYVLNGPYRHGGYSERLVTRSGKSVPLPPFKLVSGSWGIATPIPVRDIAAVRLHRSDGTTLQARLPIVQH
jgi:hypothetical protein